MTHAADRSRTQRKGFTLIELMITVAIIGLMASIAIPNFLSYQAKTRRAEAFSNLAGIARTYTAFQAEFDYFPDMFTTSSGNRVALPVGTPSSQKLDWDTETQNFFDIVGFSVEGEVWHQYDIAALPSPACPAGCTTCFTLAAIGDTDSDGLPGAIVYTHPSTDSLGNTIECTSATGYTSPPGVYDEPAVSTLLDPF